MTKSYRGSSVSRALPLNTEEVDGENPSPGSTRTDPDDTERDPYKGSWFRWGERVGLPECPYLRRWVLELPSGHSIRIHHFTASDDIRAFHDHPWWFLTFILKGSYVDQSPTGDDVLKPGSFRFRRANHPHTVITDNVWSFVITGARVRQWGFFEHLTGKFFKANKWFFTRGHHPCE